MSGWRTNPTPKANEPSQNQGNCSIHEIAIYDGELTDVEMQLVFSTLVQKWM